MTTNNHPAHGPVSLDRLHQIREILSKAAAQSDGGNLGYAMADAVKVIDGAIAATNANPIGFRCARNDGLGDWGDVYHREPDDFERKPLVIEHIYTAPPAPVVPDEMTWSEASAFADGLPPGLSTARIARKSWNDCRAAMLQAGNSPVTPDCSCRTCRPVTFTDSRFVVCPECGNKRCPHANDHRNACTGSNELGQKGGAYPAAPQQEVKSAIEHGMQRYSGAMQKLSEGDK